MPKKITISQAQADILTTVSEMGFYEGERIPWSVPLGLCATWTGPLTGLIRRGFLKEHRSNMYYITPEGEAALKAWHINILI